ncbi:MAG TPA: ATP-binding protein [Thermoanaerobaculia bacterium]|nr:ATP-binding protein [Thermoanaerobaculia bacterium]
MSLPCPPPAAPPSAGPQPVVAAVAGLGAAGFLLGLGLVWGGLGTALGLAVVWAAAVAGLAAWLAARERRSATAAAARHTGQAAYYRTQKMEAIGRLASGLAHDLNNYLGVITGQAEMVQRDLPAGDPVVRRMEVILSTAWKSSDLIRRVLAFGRRQGARSEVIDLTRVLAELPETARPLLDDEVRLDLRVGAGLWPIEGDPTQLRQAFVHLLVNAREAMPLGGAVTITAENRGHPEGDRVLLAVADSGHGIPEAIRDQVFDPFFTTKEERGKNGLGLSAVYGFVRQSGGTIEVASPPGQGARFELLFPRSHRSPLPPAVAIPPGLRRGDGERILLVEDNRELRLSTRALLEALGYRVTAAADGNEALAFLAGSGEEIDLVVTDVVLPGPSGVAVAAAARERQPDLPVVFLSGHTAGVLERHGHPPGEDVFCPKPFSAEILAGKVHAALAAGGKAGV